VSGLTTRQASLDATDRSVASPNGAFDAGLRPGPLPDRAASLLPGLLAATRTGLTPAGDDELMFGSGHQKAPPPKRWAHVAVPAKGDAGWPFWDGAEGAWDFRSGVAFQAGATYRSCSATWRSASGLPGSMPPGMPTPWSGVRPGPNLSAERLTRPSPPVGLRAVGARWPDRRRRGRGVGSGCR
jgi:hypothetical protein